MRIRKMFNMSKIALINGLCTKCNDNYYPMENDPLNLGEYINCYNEIDDGYYLDIEDEIYKKCYESCKTCNIKGNKLIHNCLECNENFPFKIEKNNYYNCYQNCSYYYYFDNENNFHCTMNFSCPTEYSQLLKNLKECIQYFETKEIEIKYYDNILKNYENIFTSEDYDTSYIDNGQDNIIKTGKITTTLTTCENQRSNINKNVTKIDLGECETKIRNYYNISINESIYIKKIDIIQEGMSTIKVEYDVYAKLSGKKFNKFKFNSMWK